MAPGTPAERAEALSILGLPSNATPEEVLRAYRRLSKRIHPDVIGRSDREADRRFAAVSDAYRQVCAALDEPEPPSAGPSQAPPVPPGMPQSTEPLIVAGPVRVSPTRAVRQAQAKVSFVAGPAWVSSPPAIRPAPRRRRP